MWPNNIRVSIYGAVVMTVTARVHSVHVKNVHKVGTKWLPILRLSHLTWAVCSPVGWL